MWYNIGKKKAELLFLGFTLPDIVSEIRQKKQLLFRGVF